MQTGIKVAVSGKGGVGKTTISAILAQLFAEDRLDVIAVDADSDTNLCNAFGIAAETRPEPLIRMKDLIAERTGTGKEATGAYFKLNPKISDLPEKYCVDIPGCSLKLLTLGAVAQAGGGCACPEGAFLRALISHTILQRQEMVIVDLAAGVEFMGRASVRGIDVLVVVVEPGSRSIETAISIAQMGRNMGIKHIAAIANKITKESQIATIKSKLTSIEVLGNIRYSPAMQEAELSGLSVIKVDPQIVKELTEVKNKLVKLVSQETKT